jgi:hypothetical protein
MHEWFIAVAKDDYKPVFIRRDMKRALELGREFSCSCRKCRNCSNVGEYPDETKSTQNHPNDLYEHEIKTQIMLTVGT